MEQHLDMFQVATKYFFFPLPLHIILNYGSLCLKSSAMIRYQLCNTIVLSTTSAVHDPVQNVYF